jgi:hypothetical protein
MLRVLALLLILIFACPTWAANTPPPGANNQPIYNKNGQYRALALNGIYIIYCPGGQSYLSLTTTVSCPSPTGNIVTPLGVPWVTPLGDNIVTP